MATAHTIPTGTHGRYLVEPGPSERLLVGFHGYGENADVNLAAMLKIPGIERWTVVAVQGLHRFYMFKTGEVVASWMTKQDRELALADNREYVRAVLAAIPTPERLVFLGFSQGAPMAYRAAAAHPQANGLVALGGDLPEDVDPSALPPVLIGRGARDEWYSAEKFEKDLKLLPGATALQLDAGHEWTEPFSSAVGEFLERVERIDQEVRSSSFE
jgi:predicted esterase